MNVEIQIRGNGPVALACGLFLARHWPDPSAIELTAANPPAAWLTQRPLAISIGSRRLIERIARFPSVSGPISTVEVALGGRLGRVRIPARDLRSPHLGDVVRHGALVAALETALAGSGVRRVANLPMADPETSPNSRPETVVIHADGDPGSQAEVREFGQSALLAEIDLTGLDRGTALERFTEEGPLAVLPLPEPDRWALVWCAPTAITQQRAQSEPNALKHALAHALGRSVTVHAIENALVMPLRRRARDVLVDPNPTRPQVWIGNAAQILHPVAGQGLNLGLRDAHGLAQRLIDWRLDGNRNGNGHRDRNPHSALLHYERSRRPDRSATLRITDALATIFTWPLLGAAQSLVLTAIDLNAPLRKTLARQFAS